MRYFRAIRTVTLPQGLQAGPGQTNMRLDPGNCCTIEDDCGQYERFLNNRVRLGDGEWLPELPKDASLGRSVPSPDRSIAATNLGMNVGAPTKKG